jgi:transcriptional regulator of arginine metabolism
MRSRAAQEQVAPSTSCALATGVEVAHFTPWCCAPPGSAHVRLGLDRAGLSDIIGTVAGDDTLIVVAAEDVGGQAVADRLADLAGL